MSQINVVLTNNYAASEETRHSVEVGVRVNDFVRSKLSHIDLAKTVIRVRRNGRTFGGSDDAIPSDFMLADGDNVSVTPAKTAGSFAV